MTYRIIRVFSLNDHEINRESTTLDFDDVYQALDFAEYATTSRDKRAGIKYCVCPILEAQETKR